MALSIVHFTDTTANIASGSAYTLSAGTPVTGNTLVCLVTNKTNGTALTSLKDGAGNSLSLLIGSANGTASYAAAFAYIVPASPQTQFTPTLAGAAFAMSFLEISGAAASVTTDGTSGTNGASAANNNGSLPSITTLNANDIIITSVSTAASNGGGGTGYPVTGYTAGPTNSELICQAKIVSSTGTYNPETIWTTSRTWSSVTLALEAALRPRQHRQHAGGILSHDLFQERLLRVGRWREVRGHRGPVGRVPVRVPTGREYRSTVR